MMTDIWSILEITPELENFRRTTNQKIAMIQPNLGAFYLLALTAAMVERLTDRQLKLLNNASGRNTGNPYAVRRYGEFYDIDYAMAAHEVTYIEDAGFSFYGKDVVEIGAGYGRTAHTTLSNFDVASYTIVDLPKMLALSQAYLATVLPPADFARVVFLESFPVGAAFDLAINIDSFPEMTDEVAAAYQRMIDASAMWFYTKNTVGRYVWSRTPLVAPEYFDAMVTGIVLQCDGNLLDIFDDGAMAAQVPRFLERFSPGEAWVCTAHAKAEPFTHYYQAVYRR